MSAPHGLVGDVVSQPTGDETPPSRTTRAVAFAMVLTIIAILLAFTLGGGRPHPVRQGLTSLSSGAVGLASNASDVAPASPTAPALLNEPQAVPTVKPTGARQALIPFVISDSIPLEETSASDNKSGRLADDDGTPLPAELPRLALGQLARGTTTGGGDMTTGDTFSPISEVDPTYESIKSCCAPRNSAPDADPPVAKAPDDSSAGTVGCGVLSGPASCPAQLTDWPAPVPTTPAGR